MPTLKHIGIHFNVLHLHSVLCRRRPLISGNLYVIALACPSHSMGLTQQCDGVPLELFWRCHWHWSGCAPWSLLMGCRWHCSAGVPGICFWKYFWHCSCGDPGIACRHAGAGDLVVRLALVLRCTGTVLGVPLDVFAVPLALLCRCPWNGLCNARGTVLVAPLAFF